MRIVNWNIGRRTPGGGEAATLLNRIAALAPDVVCLTEGHAGSLSDLPGAGAGFVLSDMGASWKGDAEDERKVLLWSRMPWNDVTPLPSLSALGGGVTGVTDTPIGPVRVFGLCAPYHMAWPAVEEERPTPWSLNIAYFQALEAVLKEVDPELPVVLVGDFNQFVPLASGNWEAHHALNAALHGYAVVTRGDVAPTKEQTLDHVAVSNHPRLRATAVQGVDRFDTTGKPLTDQFGVLVELEGGGVQIFD
jgi:hypothetical protein